jgi:hypothetical protein
MKQLLKSSTQECGEESVVVDGRKRMLEWSAGILVCLRMFQLVELKFYLIVRKMAVIEREIREVVI